MLNGYVFILTVLGVTFTSCLSQDCPPDICQVPRPDETYTEVTFNTSGKKCGRQSPVFLQVPSSITITCETTGGNECSFMVRVSGDCATQTTIPPQTTTFTTRPPITKLTLLECPQDISIEPQAGQLDVLVHWIIPVVAGWTGQLNQTRGPQEPWTVVNTGTKVDVEYHFQDSIGDNVTCAFSIVVGDSKELDVSPPEVSGCPTRDAVSRVAVRHLHIATWPEPVVIDDPDVRVSRSNVPGNILLPNSTNTVYVFTDSVGNIKTCNISFAGELYSELYLCPISDLLVLAPENASSTSVTWRGPVVVNIPTTHWDWMIEQMTHDPGREFSLGTTMVAYTFRDQSGNQRNCEFQVQVTEFRDEGWELENCPRSILRFSPGDRNTLPVTWTEPSVNVNSAVVNQTHQPGEQFEIGTTIVVYTFERSDGQPLMKCSFAVVVEDVTPPTVSGCPTRIIADAPEGYVSGPVSWTEPIAEDNSEEPVLVIRSSVPGDVFDVGVPTNVQYIFRDTSGNEATCDFTVELMVDASDDLIQNCPGNVKVNIPSWSNVTVASWTEPSTLVTNNLRFLPARTHAPMGYFDLGRTDVSYKLAPSLFCNFSVFVTDVTPPMTVNCPLNISFALPAGTTAMSSVTWEPPTFTDNSMKEPFVTSTHTPPSMFSPNSRTSVTYTATDGAGNGAECKFDVSISESNDTTPPAISNCNNDITAIAPASGNTVSIMWEEPSVEDDSGNFFSYQSHRPGDFFRIGDTRVIYEFRDEAGNSNSCVFIIMVKDETSPVVDNCPSNITNHAIIYGSQISWEEPTASDNSNLPVIVARSHAPGDFFRPGETEVSYTFEDQSGNSAQCTFTMTLTDNEPPFFVNCPGNIFAKSTGPTGARVSWRPPEVLDNTGATIQAMSTVQPGSLFPIGLTKVTYSAADASGNMATPCSFQVSVVDMSPPEIQGCPTDGINESISTGMFKRAVAWSEPEAEHEDDDIMVISSHKPGDIFYMGVTVVEYYFFDSGGNKASCLFQVQVENFICNPNITDVLPDVSNETVIEWQVPPIRNESGSITVLGVTHQPGSRFPLGATNVQYVLQDTLSDFYMECSFSVLIIDETPPSIEECPDDLTITTDGSMVAASWSEPVITDNSGADIQVTRTHQPGSQFSLGSTEVMYQARDKAGNVRDCTFMVIIDSSSILPISLELLAIIGATVAILLIMLITMMTICCCCVIVTRKPSKTKENDIPLETVKLPEDEVVAGKNFMEDPDDPQSHLYESVHSFLFRSFREKSFRHKKGANAQHKNPVDNKYRMRWRHKEMRRSGKHSQRHPMYEEPIQRDYTNLPAHTPMAVFSDAQLEKDYVDNMRLREEAILGLGVNSTSKDNFTKKRGADVVSINSESSGQSEIF